MFIAIIMENFETAEEEKRQRQVQDYLQKNDSIILEDAPIGSRWNIFRYLKPKPKGLAVDNMPSSLVLSTQKEYVREFLIDSSRGKTWTGEQVSGILRNKIRFECITQLTCFRSPRSSYRPTINHR